MKQTFFQNIEKGKCEHAGKEQGTNEFIHDLYKCKICAATNHLQVVWYSRPQVEKLLVT